MTMKNKKKNLHERKLDADSVDMQIDMYLISFEEKALKNKAVPIENDKNKQSDQMMAGVGGPPESDDMAKLEPRESFIKNKNANILKETIAYLLREEEEEASIGNIGGDSPEKKDKNMKLKLNINGPPEPNRIPENFEIDIFSANVERLISHSRDLLSLEKVIYNRACKFVLEHYDEDTKDMFETSLKTNYDLGFDPEEIQNDVISDE